MRLRVCNPGGELPEVIRLLGKFETLHSDLPSAKNQIHDLDLETIERKAHGICIVREDIKRECGATQAVGNCDTVKRFNLNILHVPNLILIRAHFVKMDGTQIKY